MKKLSMMYFKFQMPSANISPNHPWFNPVYFSETNYNSQTSNGFLCLNELVQQMSLGP